MIIETISDAHLAFKIKLDKTSSLELPSFEPEEIDFWLNDAAMTFVKQRAEGINLKKTGVEETQKRLDDLRTIIVSGLSLVYNSHSYYDNNYCFTLPTNYFRYLGDQVTINVSGTTSKVASTTTTADVMVVKLRDPYSEHNLHHQTAKPLRMLRGGELLYISDGNYSITECYLTYIRKPIEVSLSGNIMFDLPSGVYDELINIAVKKALENIESQRYQTFTGESLIVE